MFLDVDNPGQQFKRQLLRSDVEALVRWSTSLGDEVHCQTIWENFTETIYAYLYTNIYIIAIFRWINSMNPYDVVRHSYCCFILLPHYVVISLTLIRAPCFPNSSFSLPVIWYLRLSLPLPHTHVMVSHYLLTKIVSWEITLCFKIWFSRWNWQ